MVDTAPKVEETPEAEYTEEGVDAPDNGQTPDPSTADSEAQRTLLGIVSDPEIAQILAARRAGRAVKIVDVEEAPEPDPVSTGIEIPEETLEELDPTIKSVVGIISKHLDTRLAPFAELTDQVQRLQGLADQMQQKALTDQISAAEGKHKDLEKHRPEMARLSRAEGAGLSVEQLYVLSKLKAGDMDFTEPSTDSERPTPTPQRRVVGPRKDNPPKIGRKAWNTTLADALDRTLSPEQ